MRSTRRTYNTPFIAPLRAGVKNHRRRDLYPNRLLQAGARGYVTKGAGLDEMISAIETVYNGDLYMSNELAQQLALK
ncbi:MAG: hypothetical protein P8Y42_06620, partial [Exilibacterium sp.]